MLIDFTILFLVALKPEYFDVASGCLAAVCAILVMFPGVLFEKRGKGERRRANEMRDGRVA